MTGSSDQQRTYPHGVTCWVDTEQSDPQAASEFYGELFGWTFENAMPPDAPGLYLIARLDSADVAAIGLGDGSPSWNTYVAVDDIDQAASAVQTADGTIISGPEDAGPGGRTAACKDPNGAPFRLWQARKRLGAQITNVPGAWSFSNLHTRDPQAAFAFYATVFGWETIGDDDALGAMLRVPGYGDHLEATVDPEIRTRQAHAPEGFEDVVGGIKPRAGDEPEHWRVTFSVADRDESALRAEKAGATVVSTSETQWTYEAVVRDPQGAQFSISQFAPQEW